MRQISIPVMRPVLPSADRLLPYLRRIDDSRWYSNFGPLTRELESRLAHRWRLAPGSVLSLSNATQGLTVALMAAGAARESLCLMPAWTFVASAHAAVQAGMVPYLVDVDADSGPPPPVRWAPLCPSARSAHRWTGRAGPICKSEPAFPW